MAWANNNKKNARFDPNRRDDRLMMSQVTSRREHKPRKEVEPEIELVSTDPSHVLSMGGDTRLDWLQMGLVQASTGKLKVDALCNVLTNPAFGPTESSSRKALKAVVLANLHLFSSKQKKAIQEAVGAWGSGTAARKAKNEAKNGQDGDQQRERAKSSSPGSGAAADRKSGSSSASRGPEGRGRRQGHSSKGRRRSRSPSRRAQREPSRERSPRKREPSRERSPRNRSPSARSRERHRSRSRDRKRR